jgi:hypothetical protein
MRAEDIPNTTFGTCYGAYEFLIMPFGLANASAVFSLMMTDALSDLHYVLIFIDDVLVFLRPCQSTTSIFGRSCNASDSNLCLPPP